MQAEEIDRERQMSGWNQYEGEEEFDENDISDQMPQQMPRQSMNQTPGQMMNQMPQQMPRQSMNQTPGQTMNQMPQQMPNQMMNQMPGADIPQPFFMQPDFTQVMEEQMQEERDFRALQAMYPEAAKILLPFIEEECDKMEYEGSPMFDAYPDQTTIWQIQQRIRDQVADQFPQELEQEAGRSEMMQEEVFSMQFQGGRRGRPGRDWLGDLTRVLLLQEMHHRRCRHGRCRRRRY